MLLLWLRLKRSGGSVGVQNQFRFSALGFAIDQ